ncbi:MAG: relaxase/mobilization nuclease domain-containing protein [Lachnospiraceae bacterium]|nr:relaxase/mobilization nuclease domain-containing protein [Lachnospiraceae bacterium]
MGTCKIIKIKTDPRASIRYITNPDKTDGKILVECMHCDEELAHIQFANMLKNCRKRSDADIKAYHFIQTFAKDDDISPEEAHKIGMEFMERLFKGKHAFVCATHDDKKHLHNHFIVCAAERGTNRKLQDDLTLIHKMQRINDKLCQENGLYVIRHKKRGRAMKYNEWKIEQERPGSSQKSQLRFIIDNAINKADSWDVFLKIIRENNIEISQGDSKKWGTVTKYKMPGAEKFHRGYSLGEGYGDAEIKNRIELRLSKEKNMAIKKASYAEKKKLEKASMTSTEKALDKNKLKISHMINTSAPKDESEAYGLTKWKHKQNAKLSQTIEQELLQKYNIRYTDIESTLSSLRADKNMLKSKLEKQQIACDSQRSVLDNCRILIDMKHYVDYVPRAKNPDAYAADHAEEIAAYHNAVSALEILKIDPALVAEAGELFIEEYQKQLKETIETQEQLEQQLKDIEKKEYELTKAKKELDTYHGKNRDEI